MPNHQQKGSAETRNEKSTQTLRPVLASSIAVNQPALDLNSNEADLEVAIPGETGQSIEDISSWYPSALEVVKSGRLTVHLATTLHPVEELRQIWSQWTDGPDTDIDNYLHTLKSDPTVLRPYVITVQKDGVPQAMLLGQIRKRRMLADVSYIRIPGPKVRVLDITNGGRLGSQGAGIDKLLALELLKAVKSGDVDLICFERLSLHSELFCEVRQLPDPLFKARVLHVFCNSALSLTVPATAPAGDTPSIFSGKIKREVRRKARNLEGAFPGKVRFKCFAHPSELDMGIRDAMRVSIATWQHFFRYSRLDTPQTCEKFKFLVSRGWLRVFVLYIEDVPRAFLIGQLYNNTLYCRHVGFHRKFARFSLGSLLTASVFEEMAAAGVGRVDLGEGSQEHARRMGCEMREEGTLHVYSRTLLGICMNVFFALTVAVRAGGLRTLSALRCNWLVNVWRQLARGRYASN